MGRRRAVGLAWGVALIVAFLGWWLWKSSRSPADRFLREFIASVEEVHAVSGKYPEGTRHFPDSHLGSSDHPSAVYESDGTFFVVELSLRGQTWCYSRGVAKRGTANRDTSVPARSVDGKLSEGKWVQTGGYTW